MAYRRSSTNVGLLLTAPAVGPDEPSTDEERERMTQRVRVIGAMGAVLSALTLAACGSGDDNSTATTSPAAVGTTSTQAAAEGPASTTADGGVLDYAKYVGGSGKANPDLKPVVIGWVNNQGGPPSLDFPQATRAIEGAVKYANAELGGVDGHPIKLVTCFIESTAQQAQQCGQQFRSDESMIEVIGGLLAVGNDSFYKALGPGKVFLGSIGINPADYNAQDAFFLSGSNTAVFAPNATYIKEQYPDAKKVAVIYNSNPGADLTAKQTLPAYEKAGLEPSLVQYQSTATDLTSTAVLAGASDVIVPEVTDAPGCVNLAKALQQSNIIKPVLANPLCLALPPSAYPGGDYPHWTFAIAGANLADPTSPEVKHYLKTAGAYGVKPADAAFSYSGVAWGQILASIRVMNKIGFDNLTNASLAKGWKEYRGPTPLAAPEADCSGTLVPDQPTACQNQALFVSYEGDGKWKTIGWRKPPAE
jgi:branched-chain amino acid transport system substrate-binding protein